MALTEPVLRSCCNIPSVTHLSNSAQIVPNPRPRYRKNYAPIQIWPTIPQIIYLNVERLCSDIQGNHNRKLINIMSKIFEESMSFWVHWWKGNLIFESSTGFDHVCCEGELDFQALLKEVEENPMILSKTDLEELQGKKRLGLRVHSNTYRLFQKTVNMEAGQMQIDEAVGQGLLLVIASLRGWITPYVVKQKSRITLRFFTFL